MKEDTYNEDQIIAFLADELDEKQKEELIIWIEQSPHNRKKFEDIREIWIVSTCSAISEKFDKLKGPAYERFVSRIETYSHHHLKIPQYKRLWNYSAAAVIVLLIAFSSYWLGIQKIEGQLTSIVVEAPLGARTKMQLPDGSLVHLNAGSKVVYSQSFGVKERTVELIGEGYFDVVKNASNPFVVKTKEVSVVVMGTKFNFSNYPDDEEVTVTLLEGKVNVSNTIQKNREIEMAPDQKVFLNKKSGNLNVITTNAQNMVRWTEGDLFFDEDLLPDIIKELKRSYNVEIKLMDKTLESFRFYGNFKQNTNTIEDILGMFSSTGKINYSINNGIIELKSSEN